MVIILRLWGCKCGNPHRAHCKGLLRVCEELYLCTLLWGCSGLMCSAVKGFSNTPSVFLCGALTWPAGPFKGRIQCAWGSIELKAGAAQDRKLWQHIENWSICPEISLCAQYCGRAKVPRTDFTGLIKAIPYAAGERSSNRGAYRMWTRTWRWSGVPSSLVVWWKVLKKHVETEFLPFLPPLPVSCVLA